jgi:SAM-dependent methyltransferase
MSLSDERSVAYLSKVPLALGLERIAEANLYKEEDLARPILDLGCGDGLFARLAFSRPLDFGVDPDTRELEVAAAEPHAYEQVICAFGSDIPLPDNSVGTVISNSVLEHIQELNPVLLEVFRILKPSGKFVATIPSDKFEEYSAVARVLGFLKMPRAKAAWCFRYNRFWRHYNAHNQSTWREIFEAAGFEVSEIHNYNSERACLRNDLLAPFGAAAKAQKIILNRWVTFPGFRRKIFEFLWPRLKMIPIENSNALPGGGLVFIEARKPS